MKALTILLAAGVLASTPAAFAETAKKPKKDPGAEATKREQEEEEKSTATSGHPFAWPFMEWKDMMPRGGSSKGADVKLLSGAKDSWAKLNEPGLSKFEQDRRAILSMVGSYRVGFDFTETFGFSENFKPSRPYFSWATENVSVVEDTGEVIRLQHTLVMFTKNDKGETKGPHLIKHWRQDWTWQDKELQVFQGNRTWERTAAVKPEGRWSQAVFQVDDSPRYEVMGEWVHDGTLHSWRSDNCPRPLPRREFSVRKDYNVLEGVHEITIVPNGWVHLQNNRKVQVDADGKRGYVGAELGVDRYEEITSPDLATPFAKYWEKTNDYWKDVRETWATVYKDNAKFVLKDEDEEGSKLYSVHFEYAGELEKSDKQDAAANLKHAQETIAKFLEK